MLLFIVTKNTIHIYQLQYYSNERLLKYNIQNIEYKYMYFIPFVILDFIINENRFINSLY